MATTIIPVDQTRYSRIMVVEIKPKMRLEQDEEGGWREGDTQATSPDGSEKQWSVEVVLIQPSKYGNRSQTASVTIPGSDPSAQVMEGERVEFDNLVASHAEPTYRDGKIKGGRLNWQADGVHSKTSAGSYASAADTP